jgi:hypothetical protein
MEKILSREEKIRALQLEFRKMDVNDDKTIQHQELLFNLDKKNVL